jgi:hypothetical protein
MLGINGIYDYVLNPTDRSSPPINEYAGFVDMAMGGLYFV